MKKWIVAGFGVFFFVWGAVAQEAKGATAAAAASLKIDGAVATPLTLTIEDLKKMPRKTLTVTNSHDKKTEVYEGVLVGELLKKAGVPQGEHLRGKSLAAYVVFKAEDGYEVVFSIAELDSGILDSDVAGAVGEDVEGDYGGEGGMRQWRVTRRKRQIEIGDSFWHRKMWWHDAVAEILRRLPAAGGQSTFLRMTRVS
jgi:hypothetical protein